MWKRRSRRRRCRGIANCEFRRKCHQDPHAGSCEPRMRALRLARIEADTGERQGRGLVVQFLRLETAASRRILLSKPCHGE